MNHKKWYVLVFVLVGIMLAVILPTVIEVHSVSAQDPCPDNNNIWNPGMVAQVTRNMDVYDSPGSNAGVIGSIGSGEVVTIVGNYQCVNWGTSHTRWQNVQTASGVTGWIAEMQYGRSSRLQPYSGSAPSQPSGDQTGSSPSGSGGGSTCPDSPNQWSVGMQAQLTERKDLQVSTDYNAAVIERVDRGAVVTIVGNFQCSSWGSAPIRWQYVRTASGNEGWIAEQQQGRNSRFAPAGGSSAASVQQSQPASSAPDQPQSQPAIVVDGCTDHPEQVYAGESSPPGGEYLRVNVANLRVRMGPSTSWCINGYAVQGRYYPVHEVRDGWALITGTYGAGWLHTDYVTLFGSATGSQQSSNPNEYESPNTVESYPFYYEPFDHTYNFMVDQRCVVTNGADIVADESARIEYRIQELGGFGEISAVGYFVEVFGRVENFRGNWTNFLKNQTGCTGLQVEVGSHLMDTSGVGNIIFGYHTSKFDAQLVSDFSDVAQGFNSGSRWQFEDNEDDQSQICTGRTAAEAVGLYSTLSPSVLIQSADHCQLH